MSHPHVGMDGYLVVRQSQLGVCKYVIRSVSLFVHLVAAAVDALRELGAERDSFGTGPTVLPSTCKAFDLWICHPRVSGRGGSGPGRPSGIPRQCTWIMAREEACSEGGSSIPDISILGANALDNQLASEVNVWTVFLRVGVRIGLLGVTVERISGGEIGTRHWTGEQGVVAVVAAEKCPGGNLHSLLAPRRDTQGVLDGRAWLYTGEPFPIRAPGYSFLPLHVYYILRTEVCRWSRQNNKDGAIDDGGYTRTIYGDFVEVFSKAKAETLAN